MRLRLGLGLHRCIDRAYWEPALTYFGEPIGQGGCRFSVARNRKGDRLRECDKYQEGKKVEIEAKPREAKEMESLILFWKDSLAKHRLLMEPSTVYMMEQTVKALVELKEIKGAKWE